MRALNCKLIVLISIFAVTGALVYGLNWKENSNSDGKQKLSEYLRHFEGYTNIQQIPLQDSAILMLDLDDYLYAKYSGSSANVYLYIGYYYSAEKAYAAHSPSVCYPSQGWKVIDKPKRNTLFIDKHKIDYEEIIALSGKQKELVIYWYQAGDFTNSKAYLNKICIGYNKLLYNYEQHGFIRVAVPFADNSYEDSKKVAITFLKAFYPRFLSFATPSIEQHN